MATSFGVRVDGGLEAQGQSQPSRIASDLVRTYRFERAVRSGRHHLKVTMMGVRSDRRDGTMEEDDKEFDVTISPGETARIYHEWTDGIEEFAKTQPCCQRNHTRP